MTARSKAAWFALVCLTAGFAIKLPLRTPAIVQPPPNTNTIGIHAVWSPVPFADSYDVAWGTNAGDYPWTLNTVTTGAVFRWPQTNPMPTIIVRANVANQAGDWSVPFSITNYATMWCETSSNMTMWTELPPTRLTLITTNASAFYREHISNWNNFPTLP